MAPEAVRAHPCVFAVPVFPGHYCPSVAPQGRSVLRGRGRFAASPLHALFSVLRGAPAPFRSHRRRRRRPGRQPPGLLQASKLLNLQTSKQKKEPRGVGSRAVTTTRKECELTQKMAGRTGLEPATSGSTVRSSNQLSYLPEKGGFLSWKMAGRTGLEPATSGSTVRSSNQLSYLPGSRKHA